MWRVLLVVTVIGVLAGCAQAATPTGTYFMKEGDAIAVVRTWLQQRPSDYPLSRTCLDYHDMNSQGEFTASKSSPSRWLVTHLTIHGTFTWEVGDTSFAVNPLEWPNSDLYACN